MEIKSIESDDQAMEVELQNFAMEVNLSNSSLHSAFFVNVQIKWQCSN